MGLFDSIFGSSQEGSRLTDQEAFAGILMAASACDGHIADEEVSGLITALIRMNLYKRFSDRDFNKMLNKLHGVLKRHGVETLVDSCAESLPDSLVKAAFTNAVDMVLADGVVEQEERDFVERLRKSLDLDPEMSKTIVRVLVIKNKG